MTQHQIDMELLRKQADWLAETIHAAGLERHELYEGLSSLLATIEETITATGQITLASA